MNTNRPYRMLISGGGTGGHVFPAIAIATRFRECHPNAEILFVGARGKMEMTSVPKAGFKIVGLWISGLNRKDMFSNVLLPFKLLVSLIKAQQILSSFQPDVIVGTGGYASAPITFVANSRKVPILVQEQNSYAGITNRWVARKARKICVAYPHMERYFPKQKIILTGNPLQKNLLNSTDKKQEGMDFFSFDASYQTLLIMGGSLGARTINESVLSGLDRLIGARVQVLWQTGKMYYDTVREKTADKNLERIRFYEFIQRMDLAYAVSSVVVSRAGALTLSELCASGKAALLVPSPNVAEDHQKKNARALEKEGAAILIEDNAACETLVEEALKLLGDNEKRNSLSTRISRLGKPDATRDIVDEIEKLIVCN